MAAFLIPTIHRVLAIPELLDMIFQFLDDASNASNARVCKQWSDLALDTLWKEVNDLYRLFSLLCLLEKSEGSSSDAFSFGRRLEPSDWRRFDRYRRRVRKLSYQVAGATHVLHQSVFDDIARSRTSLDILPNLHTLEWNAPLPLCMMFMHKNIKSFAVSLPDALGIKPFFEDMVARMPYIKHLDLRLSFSITSIEDYTATLLYSLTRLQKLTLPRFCFTTTIAQSVSLLEDLEAVEFQYYEYQGRGEPNDVVGFKPSLVEGSFPSLWDLNMTISLDDAAHFLDMSFAPTNITSLYLDSVIIETPTDVHRLITVVAENCQLLKSLALVSFVSCSTVSAQPPDKDDCITIETLRPLLKCPNLTTLEIVHYHPLHLQQEDMEEIATSWPGVETLLLNNEPAYLKDSNLTLRALLPFARHCPKLRTLGLFLDATTADLPSSDSASGYQHPPFRALRRLSMGVSMIQEEGAVALFLSEICPLHCRVESGITWENSLIIETEILKAIQGRYDKWAKVMELLPLLTKLRIDERERARLLKKEVEDLRIRTGVLLDKASLGNPGDGCVAI